MFDRALSTALLPEKERIIPVLVELFLLESSLRNLEILISQYFSVKHSVLLFRNGDELCPENLKYCPALRTSTSSPA